MGRKEGAAVRCAPFGRAGSPSNRMWPGPRATSVPSGILMHPVVPQQTGLKIRGLCPFFFGGAGSPSSTMSPGPRPTFISSGILIHPAVWPQRIWAENWGLCPFGGRAGSTFNPMWPGTRPTSMPSFILIHRTVWPKCTNVTDRQTGQRSDSIGRTVLQMVAQRRFQTVNVAFKVTRSSVLALFDTNIISC